MHGATQPMRITILTCGGTIDKIYFDAKSDYQVGDPNIKVVLDGLCLAVDYRVVSLLRKDSLDMTDADRQLIADAVRSAPDRHVVITHGTDTMVQTARAITGIGDKVVVLTGAIQPAMFVTSDAVFNIGCAIAAAQTCAPGVYIAMNGRIFNPGQVRKNDEAGRFEETQ